MLHYQLAYVVQTAWAALMRARAMACLNAISVSLALLLLAVYAMAVHNLDRLAARWGAAVGMVCILDDTLDAAQQRQVQTEVAHIAGVASTTLVDAATALRRFAARSPEAATLVEGVDSKSLPATVELKLHDPHTDVVALQALRVSVGQVAGVADVDFGGHELVALRHTLTQLRWGGMVLGGTLALAVVVLLANSIRMTVHARRQELTVLRLVGAAPWFVRLPFVVEGAMWGAGGGALSALGLYLMHAGVGPRIDAALTMYVGRVGVQLFGVRVAVAMLLAGIALGACGSSLALQRCDEARER